jgi:hypothetical protein
MPAPGYRSVTVHQKHYDALKSIADRKDTSITELLGKLIEQYSRPYVRAMIEKITANEPDFEAPYHAFVLDPKIKYYASTSWVRTEDYAERMRGPMLLELAERIRVDDDFSIEKILILSQDSWNKKKVLKWIREWLTFRFLRENQIRIFVLKQKIADKMLASVEKDDQKRRQYYDMGIYAEARDKPAPEEVVGFLEIDSQSRPGNYGLVLSLKDPAETKRAEKYFGELRKWATIIEDERDLAKLQEQSYD